MLTPGTAAGCIMLMMITAILVTVTLPDTTTRSYIYQHATQAVTNGTATYSTHLIIEEDKPDGRVLQNAYDSQRRVTNQLSTAGASLTPIRTATFIFLEQFRPYQFIHQPHQRLHAHG